MKKLLPLFIPIALSGYASAQSVTDYPLQGTFDYADAARIDALSIVECLAPGKATERLFEVDVKGSSETQSVSMTVWTEAVRVVDSTGLRPGAQARLVTPFFVPSPALPSRPAYRMVPGHRYLVLASLPKTGRLETPYGRTFSSDVASAYALPGEASGLAIFETKASVLDASPKVEDRIANAVVDCMEGADDAGIQRIANWLTTNGDPAGGRQAVPFGREPFPLSKRIASIAKERSAYVRFRLFQTLCEWHVFGSEQEFVNAVLDMGSIVGNPVREGDVVFDDETRFATQRAITDPKYVPVRLDAERWAAGLIGSKNDFVRGYLLQSLTRVPNEATQRRIALALLTSPNIEVTSLAANYFSHVLKRPEIEPVYERISPGESKWTNKDASLKAIREHYGIKEAVPSDPGP